MERMNIYQKKSTRCKQKGYRDDHWNGLCLVAEWEIIGVTQCVEDGEAAATNGRHRTAAVSLLLMQSAEHPRALLPRGRELQDSSVSIP
jgi:hypothetical protein